MSTGVRPRLHHARRDRGDQGRAGSSRVRVDVLADHGAFNATAQPTKYPAGFFHIFTGSYDLEAAHCTVKGVYTNKAPGGVAYALLVPGDRGGRTSSSGMVDVLADELGDGPGRAAAEELHPARAVPLPDARPAGCTTPATTRRAMRDGDGHGRLRRAAPRAGREARARRADGHRRLVLHRDRRRRPAQAHGHPRARHGRRRRAARPPDRQGRAAASAVQTPGPGPRDDVRADRRRGARHPAGGHRGRPRRHRPDAVRPRHLRQPLDAGVRRGDRDRRAQGPRQGAADRRRRCSRSRPTTSSGRRAAASSRATRSRAKTIQEIAHGRARHARAARGRRGPPRRRPRSTTRRT